MFDNWMCNIIYFFVDAKAISDTMYKQFNMSVMSAKTHDLREYSIEGHHNVLIIFLYVD